MVVVAVVMIPTSALLENTDHVICFRVVFLKGGMKYLNNLLNQFSDHICCYDVN